VKYILSGLAKTMPNQLIPFDHSEKRWFGQQVIGTLAQCGLSIHDFCKANCHAEDSFSIHPVKRTSNEWQAG
jgi:hypothetical protein